MAVADLYQSYGDALLPHTDVGGQAKPLTSLLAQVRAGQMLERGRHAALACLCSRMSSSASAAPLRSCCFVSQSCVCPIFPCAQILLKCSSNDKKFVIEEAQRALQVCKSSAALSRHCTAMSEVIGCRALSGWIAGAPRTALLSPLIQLLNHLPFAPCLLAPGHGGQPEPRREPGPAAALRRAAQEPQSAWQGGRRSGSGSGTHGSGRGGSLRPAAPAAGGQQAGHRCAWVSLFVFWCGLPAMLLWRAAAVVVPCSALLCSLLAPAASILTLLLLAPLNPSRRQHAGCARQRQARHRLPACRIRQPRSGGAAGV